MIVTMIHRLRSLSLCFLLASSVMACSPTVANRGNMVDEEKLEEVKAGESSREDVARILGTPTQVSTFDENTWYYFGRSTKQYSFLNPEVVAQQAVEVHFDDSGIVTKIAKLDPTEAQDIAPVDRRTPTYGHETTILEQLVGNLGKPAGLAGKEGKK
ncbi:MAG: outer membrane protein assembly factor BamE [Alphaproteobacteria bacterium]|nr:outer membrane protein assembly factor BamE [Alphaproteobacteria bacterium]